MHRRLSTATLVALLVPPPLGAAGATMGRPVPVSPGDASRLVDVDHRCPTFSWARVDGADRYELSIYRVAGDGEDAVLVLRRTIDGRAGSWTPTLGSCLERGGRYAWSLRARDGGLASAWSSPAFFRVAPGPTAGELEAALALLRAHAGGGAAERAPTAGPVPGAGPATGAVEESEPAGSADTAAEESTAKHESRAFLGEASTLGLAVEGRVEAAAFVGDGSALASVEATGLSCAGCVDGAELAAGSVTAASLGEACASGQVLMRGTSGWECATVTAPACAPGDEIACYTGPPGTRGVGACAGGRRLCVADSTWGACSGEVTPAPAELCDGLDNTCDGEVDAGDPAALCPLTANVAATQCDAAACAITACEDLWADADGDYANGCEEPASGHCLDGAVPRPIVAPTEGQLVIREILADPASPLTDAAGEWFEVAVLAPVDLNGLGIGTAFGTVIDEIDAADCLPAAPGDVLLFARSADPAANGGLAPNHLFGFSLVNGGGELHLARDGNLVDAVSWGAGDVASGRSRNLPPGLEDAASNDDPASWCNVPAEPSLLYAEGNHGTPGLANEDCP